MQVLLFQEAMSWRCSVKKVFLKICLRRYIHRYFSVNVMKFLRTPFLQKTSGQLLLSFSRGSLIESFYPVSKGVLNIWMPWKHFEITIYRGDTIYFYSILQTTTRWETWKGLLCVADWLFGICNSYKFWDNRLYTFISLNNLINYRSLYCNTSASKMIKPTKIKN